MPGNRTDNVSQIIVLGGTGFVGRAVAESWPSPQKLRFLVHRSKPWWLENDSIEVRHVDFDDLVDFGSALGGGDVLVNLLRPDGRGWYPALLHRLATTFQRSSLRRCIHASSIDVYSGTKTSLIDQQTPTHPLSAYEQEHCTAEGIISESFPETVILRLGAIFGSGGRNIVSFAGEMRQAPFWKLALRRSLYGHRRMHLVSVETVCQAIAHVVFLEHVAGSSPVVLTQDEANDNNFAFVQDTLASSFGRRSLRHVPILPDAVLRLVLRSRGLSIHTVQRRFSGKRAVELGLNLDGFQPALRAYADHLATTGWEESQ